MNTMQRVGLAVLGALVIGLCGCEQPSLSEMMTRPERPAALDKLDVFVGKWNGEMTFMTPDGSEKMSSTGMTENRWMADGRIMMEEGEYRLENGEKMNSIAIYLYEPKTDKFRYWWFTDWNMVSEGHMHKDASGKWVMKAKSMDLGSGDKWMSKGSAEMVGSNVMKWEGAEYFGLIPMKMMEMTGESRRQ